MDTYDEEGWRKKKVMTQEARKDETLAIAGRRFKGTLMSVVWIKTAPSQNDARSLPQLYDWLRRFNVTTQMPRFKHFYKTDPGGRKVKGDVQVEAILGLFDLVAGEDTVVACGAPVVKALLGPVNMAYVHGIPHVVEIAGETKTVFPMYDPAAGLASKGLMAVIAHDLDRLGSFLRGELTPWHPDPRPAVSKWLLSPLGGPGDRAGAVVAVDSEGWSSCPWGLQFSWDGETAWTIRADQPRLLDWFNQWIQNKVVVMHNGIHDLTVLRAMGIEIRAFEDTQLMAYHHMLVTGSGALESESQNLGTLGYRYAGILLGELSDIPGVDLENRIIPYTDQVLEYAGQDAIATRRLFDVFWPWLEAVPDRMKVYRIDQGQAFLIRHMMDCGLPFDYDDVTDYYIEIMEKEKVSRERVTTMAERRGLKEFNPRSPDQVRALITEKYGLKVRKRTKSGKASTNEKALATHRDHPFVQALQEYREITKLEGTYLTPLMEALS